jgi:hypothetical protein
VSRAVTHINVVAEAESGDAAVRLLCKSAAGGELNAAKALIPWINQALGVPTERVEHRLPASVQVHEGMSEEPPAPPGHRQAQVTTGYGHRSSGREPSVHAVCGLSGNGLATNAREGETPNPARFQTRIRL